jgi:hypothetical protein
MNSLRFYVSLVLSILGIWVGGDAISWHLRGYGPRLASTGQFTSGEQAEKLIRNQAALAFFFFALAIAWFIWLWKLVLGDSDLE